MLILNRPEIAELLSMESVIDAVERAHRAAGSGKAAEGSRTGLPIVGTDSVLIPMAASIGPDGASGIKLLTDSPANPEHGRPRQQSVILLLDPVTHAVEALLDGAEITMMRTAAASAVATKYLARADAATLGLVGAGRLARAHLHAISLVRPIRRVVVWTRNPDTLAQFVEDMAGSAVDIIAARSVREVAATADVICTLTPARDPLLFGEWLQPGTHVNAVGAPPRAGYREIDSEVIRRSRVVVDDLAIALHESDAIQLALSDKVVDRTHVNDDLGAVVAGKVVGRSGEEEITLYNSVGLALQDLATARLVVDLARTRGRGCHITLGAPAARVDARA